MTTFASGAPKESTATTRQSSSSLTAPAYGVPLARRFERADVDEHVSEAAGQRGAQRGGRSRDHRTPEGAVVVLAREQRHAAEAAAAEDLELTLDGFLIRCLADERVVRVAHAAHQALRVAHVGEVKRREGLEPRTARWSPGAGDGHELRGRDARREEEDRKLVVRQAVSRRGSPCERPGLVRQGARRRPLACRFERLDVQAKAGHGCRRWPYISAATARPNEAHGPDDAGDAPCAAYGRASGGPRPSPGGATPSSLRSR